MSDSSLLPDDLNDDSDSQHERYSALKTYISEDIRKLALILIIAGFIGLGINYFILCICLGLIVFFALQLRSLYLVNQWISQHSNEPPPDLSGVWGALLFNVYRAQRRERTMQAEMVGLIDRAQSSLMALEEAVVLVDEQHYLEWWNPAAERLLGLKFGDRKRPVQTIMRNPEFIKYFNHVNDFPDGLVIESSLAAGRYTQIKITRFGYDSRLLVAYDVTRIRKLEQMRKDFVDNVSHELRTPLTVLSGYLETLYENDEMPQRWRRAFDQMQQQTRRMNALVNDLLLLSRLESESLQSKNQIIDMAELMNQLFDDAQGYNTEYGHTLNLNLESHNDLIGSDMELASAFGNLITNAIKYTPPHGTVTISWQDRGEEAIFSVQDTGIGINSLHLPRLTERFYRVDSGRSRETGGTGLGLAIVKHVLAQHDAYLEVESKEQLGSIFRAVFPKHRLHPPENPSDHLMDGE
ncbi:phosphate regulon sensor histidine kinase PhoR [Acinetobacter qingfengensis]|uniref:histidine kinase n=1 Tax=Acinetobacter qingfengensis TaxID=1262585 RepID=A0A1E7RE55_9GAMM|nr:phosphate regulon sensor histidine kinase PhoR [Acinetobacter qingfengensis]KAA8733677.1 phosphate regulon sensor histidine kinase PhoR [Acinetobacter qingfengensis]OEY97507.1 phosphate regulon sensor histidine kinase PhoR [Acinetobacter qingfengensis]